ncbi:MAG TPA: class I SAM-dependent methyltransferase [Verrucomicrobiae bacterium]|nr:class I SAM-dependent methyltransferase [Verrucomicrobiae bacterium]
MSRISHGSFHASKASSALPRLRLRVTADAERRVRSGHPWLFAESIREQNRDGELGELAVIYDRQDRFLAIGLFDPDSPLRVRVLHAGKPVTIDSDWWQTRLDQALARRRGLFDEHTTGYRWINGESDDWPGLVLDRYDTTLVLKLYTAAWLPRLEEILGLLRGELKPERIVLRLSRNIQDVARKVFGKEDGAFLFGDRRDACPTFLETGLRFEADVLRGQKTGFFLDQRENRRIVESLARGRDMLNAFSFTGGFSVYAARGGATSVTDLEISAHALEAAKRNFALNHAASFSHCRHETIQADAFEWLAQNSNRKFDLIILDPPSLAKRESERAGAILAYGRLANAGITHLRRGGILAAGSCSAHVSAGEFFGAVRSAARNSRRKFAELRTTGHPPDHPATFPEAQYLKCIYLEL